MSNESDRDVRTASVRLDETGRLVVSVVDSGPLVERIFGDSDYEFWYTVSADRLIALADRLGSEPDHLVEDIRANWLGERFYDFETILREPEVGAKFTSY